MAMLHPFDPAINRPRPNADGSVSTEVTRTIQFPDGSWANVPSLWWGEGDAVRDFGEMGDDQIGGLASQYEQSSGKQFPRFSDLPSAEAAAKSRSNAGGGGQGVITGGKPVTLERLAEGIRRANANGDIETVKKLGMAYRQMQGQRHGAPTALTGSVTPQGSSGAVSQNVGFAEGQAPTAQSEYDRRLDAIRRDYYPNVDDAKWAEIAQRDFAPYDNGQLLNAGLTFGLNDEASGASAALAAALSGQDAGKAFNDFMRMEQDRKTLGAEQQGALGTVAEVGGAILAGRPDQAATRAVGTIPAIIQGGREAATQGALYGFTSTDGDLKDRAVGGLQGAATGAAVGAAVPAVAAGVRRMLSPAPASASRKAAADVLKSEGVTLTAGQRTGSKKLQYLESELGGGAADVIMERQAEEYTGAILKKIGVQGTRATPDVVDAAYDAIGQQFDNLAAITNTPFDNTLQNNLLQVAADYADTAGTPAPIIERMVNRLGELAKANNGRITGEIYKEVRSTLGRLSKAADPSTRMALRELQEALDDAVERNAGGQTKAAWQRIRRTYQNFLVVERAVTSAGQNAASGLITPAQLRSAAINQNRRAFARGKNDFTKLANAGVEALTPLPQSGTSPRLAARAVASIPALLGGAIGSPAGVPGLIAGGLAGAAAPWAIGRGILSGPGRAYLGNQVFAGPTGGLSSALGTVLGRGAQPLLPPRSQ